MALHPDFPRSPYAELVPSQRWFPADESFRETAYEKLLAPLVAKVREGFYEWRQSGYKGASATSVSLLNWWFGREHLLENADGSLSPFRYYFAQREAVETLIWLYDVKKARDKYDLMRFDASGAVSAGMFAEEWPRYVLKWPQVPARPRSCLATPRVPMAPSSFVEREEVAIKIIREKMG